MWLENLKELKKKTGMSSKQIAEKTSLPERTVARIFSGDTDNPYVDTLHRIVTVLGGSLDDILADTKAVVASESLVEVKETAIVAEAERDVVAAENEALKEQVTTLTAENAVLRAKVEELRDKVDNLKDELIETHKHYIKLKSN
jgi:transcriptional regulator with XRE-family HTH domain